MKDSLIIIFFFSFGLILGFFHILPEFLIKNSFSTYSLYLLLFLVGIGMGAGTEVFDSIRSNGKKFIFVPLCIIIGSVAGALIISLFIKDINCQEASAVGAGFGYYSLSSVIIANLHSESLGVIALIANISRELITLLFVPLLVRIFGPLAGVASGGATAIDTTLPVIVKFSGRDIGVIAVFSGFILTLITPFLVTFILKL